MLHRSLRVAVTVFAVACSGYVFGQAAPPQFFVVCGSQPNEPTVYFSGVLQGPATAFTGFRNGFSDFLSQHYSYKGAVGCLPARDAAQAQKFIADRSVALRNAKKNVVDTGWSEGAAAAMPVPAAPAATAARAAAPVAPVAQNRSTARPTPATKASVSMPAAGSAATTAGSGGSAASDASSFASALGSIFGAGGSAGAAGGGAGATAGAADKSAGAKSGAGSAGAGTGGQSPFEQVSNTLSSVFASKSGGADAPSKAAPAADPDGGLGSAQSGSTKLVIQGCGRQDARVACVTELTNQNQKDTLVRAADVWTDAFIVDDRGDRHARSSAFFLNVDGDQRSQLDVSYGKTARFILMFDDVPTKVQKVTLRSASSTLDVEDVSLIAPATQGNQHH